MAGAGPGGDEPAPRAADLDLAATADYVASVQLDDGLIPWYQDGPADPWDHVEAAMGLTVGGRNEAAEAAYRWLADAQLEDGSWPATYGGGTPARDAHRETHHAAYVATGVWHHYRVTGDRDFLASMWPTVEAGLEFALDWQAETGEVYWAVAPDGRPYEDALLTGNSSIYKSVECGLAAARELGRERADWSDARRRLGEAIRSRPGVFDRSWESKDGYSMDWFYPPLCGAVTGEAAEVRLDGGRERFVERGLGCRCVAEEPWVTVAETAELVIALAAAGRQEEAAEVLGWLDRFRDDAGGYWTGYQLANDEVWPEERPTWTAGAVLLAADAVDERTPASGFFGANGSPEEDAEP